MLRCGSWRSRLFAGQPDPCFCRARLMWKSWVPRGVVMSQTKDHLQAWIAVPSFLLPVRLRDNCYLAARGAVTVSDPAGASFLLDLAAFRWQCYPSGVFVVVHVRVALLSAGARAGCNLCQWCAPATGCHWRA